MTNPTDNDKLPPIFVVSLAKDKARRDHIKQQFAKYQFDYQFIDAVDGALLDEDAINKVYSNKKAIKNISRPMPKSEIGCALSHLSIYHKMLKENIPEAIIFEDDVVILKSFLRTMQNINQVLPENWELLLLGYMNFDYICYKKIASINKQQHFSIIKPLSKFYGAYAYLINQRGAERLIKQSQPLSLPIDHYTADYKMIDVYCVHPECTSVNSGLASSIENERANKTEQSAKIQNKQALKAKYWPIDIAVKIRNRLICIVNKVNYLLKPQY